MADLMNPESAQEVGRAVDWPKQCSLFGPRARPSGRTTNGENLAFPSGHTALPLLSTWRLGHTQTESSARAVAAHLTAPATGPGPVVSAISGSEEGSGTLPVATRGPAVEAGPESDRFGTGFRPTVVVIDDSW